MRPVVRGNRNTYMPDTPALTNSVAAVRRELDRLNAVHGKIGVIEAELTSSPTYKRPRREDIQAATNAGIATLQTEEARLTTAYQQAKGRPVPDDVEILESGGKLLNNLKLHAEMLRGLMEADADVIESAYPRARADLIQNIGQYCSYCEMPLGASLAVEHMLPKADFPDLAATWTNFLLACPICNSTKSKKPSRELATREAQSIYSTPTPTAAQVIAAGYESMIWPTDPYSLYPNFTQCYQYVLRKADRSPTAEFNVKELSAFDVNWRISENRIYLEPETGDQIRARFYDEVETMLVDQDAAAAYLQGLPAGDNRDLSRMPADLKRALAALGVDVTDVAADFILKAGSDHPESEAGLRVWTLTEVRRYTVNLLGALATVKDVLERPTNTKVPSVVMRSPLLLSIFPPGLATHWGYDPFDWEFTSERKGVSLREFDVTIKRQFEFLPSFMKLAIFKVSTANVEIILKAAADDNVFRRQRAIDFAGLNSMTPEDLKASDRRVAKRTRAWFTAADTIRRMRNALELGSPIKEQMQIAAKHTMIGTGFWTVWYSLVLSINRIGSPSGDALLRLLNETANFAGTRG